MHAFARAGATLSLEQGLFMVLQLLQGLDYAHKKTDAQGNPLQIVHCDVSPDNCLVSFEGEVKLLDFGIARASTGLSNYKEGMLMGKLGYVAPEQASLETRWDHRVDIFATGIILYELLTKQKPFPKATDVESLIASRKAKVVPPSTLDPRLPREVDEIVTRALAYDPARRYADARGFAEALVDVLFPTPQSAVQDLLSRQMHQVFQDRIGKQRKARAHDALIMKVLANVAGLLPAAEGPASTGSRPIGVISPVDPAELEPLPETASQPTTPEPRGVARPPQKVVVRRTAPGVVALALLAGAAAGAAGAGLAAPWARPGVVLVTSEPPGAEVALDGQPAGQRTPAALEGVRLSRPHEVTLSGPGLKAATLPVEAGAGRLVARVHARLASTIGALTVESIPPGAEVRIDDRPAGVTPVTIPGVRLDERHRIDLLLAGHDIDQVVVLPERDGPLVRRSLAPLAPVAKKPR